MMKTKRLAMLVSLSSACILACTSREYVVMTEAGSRIESVELARSLAFRRATNEGEVAWGFQYVFSGSNVYAGLNKLGIGWGGASSMLQLTGSSRLVTVAEGKYGPTYIENALFPMTEAQAVQLAAAPEPITLSFEGQDADAPLITLTSAQTQSLRAFIQKRAAPTTP